MLRELLESWIGRNRLKLSVYFRQICFWCWRELLNGRFFSLCFHAKSFRVCWAWIMLAHDWKKAQQNISFTFGSTDSEENVLCFETTQRTIERHEELLEAMRWCSSLLKLSEFCAWTTFMGIPTMTLTFFSIKLKTLQHAPELIQLSSSLVPHSTSLGHIFFG